MTHRHHIRKYGAFVADDSSADLFLQAGQERDELASIVACKRGKFLCSL